MTFNEHARYVNNSLGLRLSQFRRIAKLAIVSRSVLHMIYNGYVQGFYDFGLAVYWKCNETNKVNIRRKLRKFARVICGGLPGTSNDELNKEAHITLPEDRRNYLLLRLRSRMCRRDLLNSWNQSYNLVSVNRNQKQQKSLFSAMKNAEILIRNADPGSKDFLENVKTLDFLRKPPPWILGDRKIGLIASRLRMGVINTRKWAKRLNLTCCATCRHCNNAVETLSHLMECLNVDVPPLLQINEMDKLRPSILFTFFENDEQETLDTIYEEIASQLYKKDAFKFHVCNSCARLNN